MGELIRKTWKDTVAQYLIDNGKNIVDCANPLGLCKKALETIEGHNRDRFIQEVLDGLKDVDAQSLDVVKSLQLLYKSSQVISKAMTKDKLNRFKNLTINGIINQNSLSDNDYETYLNIVDKLTDDEFIYLYNLVKTIPQKPYQYDEFRKLYNLAITKLKKDFNFNDDKILYVRNSLAGHGLLDYVLTYGGNQIGKITNIAYLFVEYVGNGGSL